MGVNDANSRRLTQFIRYILSPKLYQKSILDSVRDHSISLTKDRLGLKILGVIPAYISLGIGNVKKSFYVCPNQKKLTMKSATTFIYLTNQQGDLDSAEVFSSVVGLYSPGDEIVLDGRVLKPVLITDELEEGNSSGRVAEASRRIYCKEVLPKEEWDPTSYISLIKTGEFTIIYTNQGECSLYEGHRDVDTMDPELEPVYEFSAQDGYLPEVVQVLAAALGGNSDSY